MKCIVNDDVVLSQPLEGPLSAHIAGFAKWARDEGYALFSRHRQVLLQAGVDLSVIALWLGHESVETTQIYLEATLAMKEQALSKTTPLNGKFSRFRPGDRLLGFLNNL